MKCSGQLFVPSDKHNLAGENFSDYWVSDIYDMRTYGNGVCHTYNPPAESNVGADSQFGIFLGLQSMNSFEDYNLVSFSLFLHEKGQFWPLPSLNKLTISPNKSLEVSFSVLSRSRLADEDYSCAEEENYSFTRCLQDFIAKTVGCSLNWFQMSMHPKCSTKEELIETKKIMDWIKSSPGKNVSYISGCFQKCKSLEYDISEVSEEKIVWERDWISEVFINTNSAKEIQVIEFISYDLWNMIGDCGGYLGLFLGWSLLSILFYFQEKCFMIFLEEKDQG